MRLKLLFLEPFWGGSHQQFGDVLMAGVDADWTALTLPARHWKWRMRSAAVHWALGARGVLEAGYDGVVASSYVPLAELLGLVPALARVPSLLYFHENQLAFPTSDALGDRERVRDYHFGFTQLSSAAAATRCAFNSAWNRDSFLGEATRLLRRMPKPRPGGWVEGIAAKSEVLHVPVTLPNRPPILGALDGPPVILWNHRWEHDKRPDAFFNALAQLAGRGLDFRVIVTGQRFRAAPPCFEEARRDLGQRIIHCGYAETRTDYEDLLQRADIAVSTAGHEFFGIAMIEATHFGAYPLVPDRLAYPEIFPAPFRYASDRHLVERLGELLGGAETLRADRRRLTERFGATALDAFRSTLVRVCEHV